MEMSKDKFQGDLSDIVRATSYGSSTVAVGTCSSSEAAAASFSHHHWMFLSDPMDDFSCVLDQQDHMDCSFGDPFSNMRDPFLLQHQLDNININMPAAAAPAPYYFGNRSPSSSGDAVIGSGDNNNNNCFLAAKGNIIIAEDDDDMMRRPPNYYCNNNIILSNMIQISPKPKLPFSSTCSDDDDSSKIVNAASTSNNRDHGHNNTGTGAVQISSPSRNNPAAGLKRRKSQAKKSICIPAPTAPNSSRQSGEVVPSDLWAWRKYGQKPIKGSPYPRGYYRCSSSKGCPARKQVERSRTDPNMLVITYTSEHNHPWPTQRNALAGSSRPQPSKNNNVVNSSAETTDDEPQNKGTTANLPQEEQESNISTDNSANSNNNINNNNNNGSSVKLEEINDGMMENQRQLLEMDDDDDGGFSNGSSVVVPYNKNNNNKQLLEDLFAKLGEMQADDDGSSVKGLINDNAVDHHIGESKGLDPFHHHVFDWSGDNSTRSYHLDHLRNLS